MQTTQELKGIIFDLDGTLANTLPICFTAFRHTFLKYLNRHLTDAEIARHFGPNEEGIFQKLLPSQWESCLQMYLEEYEKAHIICNSPFPGIETALNLCQEKKIALSIVTGKGKYSAAISLRFLGLENYFNIIETGSVKGGIKPLAMKKVLEQWNFSPQHTAYVGDSPTDIVDAKEVGVIPLAAAWAETANFERLEAMNPAAIFSTVNSLISWINLHVI